MPRWLSWLFVTPSRQAGAPVAPGRVIRANPMAVVIGCVLLLTGAVILAFPDTSSDLWLGVACIVGAPLAVLSVRRYNVEFGDETIKLQWVLHHRLVHRAEMAGLTATRHPLRPWALADLLILLRDDDVVPVPQALLFWRRDYGRIASMIRAWAETEEAPLEGGGDDGVVA